MDGISRMIRSGFSKARLAAACIILMTVWVLMGSHVFAAGTYTVSGTFDKGADLGGTVTYKLYHVGHFNGGALELEQQYQEVGAHVDYNRADYADDEEGKGEAEWREAWMTSAATLANYVRESDLTATHSSANGKFAFPGVADGLYLITGTSQSVTDGTKTTYWTPRPMYVAVNREDQEVSLKPASDFVEKLTITKAWENDEKVKDLIRPESIDVEIYFGSTKAEDLRETVTLSDKNDWTYTWDAASDEADLSKWFIQEKMSEEDKENYSVSYSYSSSVGETENTAKTITMTNTYDREVLRLKKTMVDYVSHASSQAQAIVFEITGYANGSKVMHRYAGMSYGLNTEADQELLLTDIPKIIDRITVTETYTGNYKPEGPATKDAELTTTENGKAEWTVSFKNVYDDDTTYGSGIINKYSILNGAFKFDKAIG